ncbi:MAG: NADH-quinone oxidoreductase subunit NuoF [Deltaproteobacteria bacterium]|nr:NADH-quinone oxidoreductase subunit NuoF [Deltaproteobacteria bacterium]
MPEKRLLLRSHLGVDFTRLDNYLNHGGFAMWKRALELGPDGITAEVKASGLRGRGGAGFPTGTKWGFLPKDGRPRYLVVNADEGEPGTFKDRYFLEEDPFRQLEGILISAYAIGAHICYIYIRGEYWNSKAVTEDAVAQMYRAGWLGRNIQGSGFDLDVYVHSGAGAYICGEETALIESIEGKPGMPRLKPPFPANYGVFGYPTIVNNTETLAAVPVILEMGGAAWCDLGSPKNGGTKLVGVSGHVKNPGLFEVPMGTPMREIIYDLGGGILDDKEILAIIPGGSSCPFLTKDEIDVPMDFDGLKAVGSMLGTACITVIAEGTDLIGVMGRVAKFYQHESCGQCTPCRQGTGWLHAIVQKLDAGAAGEEAIDLLVDACNGIDGNTICAHGEAAAWPIRSICKKFRPQLEAAIRQRAAAAA